MHDSLISRFRGVFLGAFVGEAIGISTATLAKPQTLHPIERGQLQLATSFTYANRLVQQTKQILQTLPASHQLCPTLIAALKTQQPSSPAELAITTLPIALFYHDQPTLFHAALQQLGYGSEAAVWGHTCSLALRERLTPAHLIPQLIKDLNLPPNHLLTQQLIQSQTWIEHPINTATVCQQLKQLKTNIPSASETLPLALALYGFLSTPDDYRLSLLQVARLADYISLNRAISCTLVGVISGLYNGLIGLPLLWRQQIWSKLNVKQIQSAGITSEQQIIELADHFLAVWSGAQNPTDWLKQPHTNITTAPRVIR